MIGASKHAALPHAALTLPCHPRLEARSAGREGDPAVTAMQLDALILHEPHSWIPFPTLRVAGDDTERSAWQAEPCFIQERAIR
jgi:hypothetical protein